MDIAGKLPPVHPKPEVKPDSVSSAAPKRSIVGAIQRDQVHLSEQARHLKAAREVLRQMPIVDLDKVAEIKARLKEGRYTVDPRKTASKMLQDALLNEFEQPK